MNEAQQARMGEIVISDYDPNWPQLFEELRVPIWQAVGEFALRVVHVGSTSVPGLAAKPIIDMIVVVPSTAQVLLAVERLSVLGYAPMGDLGIPGREALNWSGPGPRRNLYVCPADSAALASQLTLREYLLNNPEAADDYGDLKRKLAQRFPTDGIGYSKAKTPFIVGLLRKAGVSEEALSGIEAVNRSL